MSISSSEILLDRVLLKRKLSLWRVLSIIALVFGLIAMSGDMAEWSYFKKPYIARILIEDVIRDDIDLLNKINKIKNSKEIKAVIIHIDSPGGTAVGGEQLYKSIKDLSAEKPVVTLMRTMATSAAYMAAIAGEKVYAMEGTITGSIGVILQSFEVTELANKLGIKPIIIKSSELKASPNPFEKLTPKSEKAVKEVIADFYDFFVTVVVDARHLPREEVLKFADGRIYTGRQALKYKLIDAIGGEKEALEWLQVEKGLDKSLKIEELKGSKNEFEFMNSISSFFNSSKQEGLLALWRMEGIK